MINTLMTSNALSIARQFILAPARTGAISPASTQLSEQMVKAADVAHQQSIVELGPGTGSVTEVIAANLSAESEFFALELNPVFAEKTRQRCPGVKVYEGNALKLADSLAHAGMTHCDCILSSLPWTLFDSHLQQQLLSVIASSLRPGGTFVTYAYCGAALHPAGRRFLRLMNETFAKTQSSTLIWQNVPPARVFTCHT